jgi:Kef-type K+ transport system membrane component KefB
MLDLIQNLIVAVPEELVILTEIGILLIIACIFAFLVRILKQPLIIAYIITGIIIGPLLLGLISDLRLIQSFANIGVAFLIFSAGLEIKLRKLKEVGKVSGLGGIIQICLFFLIGFFISMVLGFAGFGMAPVYIGLVLAFSSTMIVVKHLADKRQINSLHGRIIIGILLVQDLVAIIALTVLSSDFSYQGMLMMLGKAGIFIVIAIILSKAVNPVFKKAAPHHELFLLLALSLLFLFAIGSSILLDSLIIGAFFAGVALANSDFKTEIQGKIASLRDFFAVIFFVALGMLLQPIPLHFIWLLIASLVIVIVVKPFIIMFLVRVFGYKKRTSFLSGNALAQTSEFSLIIVTLGLSLGHIGRDLFSTLVLLTILTMSISVYFIKYDKKLAKIFARSLNFLNWFHSKKEELEYLEHDGKRIILFGCHRMGSLLLKEFEQEKKNVVVVDYNPEIIRSLINKRVPCIYGDYMNEEILERINIKNAEMVISTIPEFEDNLLLIKRAKQKNRRITIFIVADRISEALELYKQGADYVFLPQVIGARKGVEIIKKMKTGKIILKDLKKEHIKYLDSIHHLLY